tara:strand:+ start:488 stop:739 length:252 start_codon:yes stop_codon:yes gene_type:complete
MEFDQLKDDINNIHKTLIRMETNQGNILNMVTKHDSELYGNGHDGLKIRIDRIETSGRLFSKIAGLGFLGAFGKIITDIFKGA